MATHLVCRVHPVVLFSIVDSYERRNEDSKRVIGTLLGSYEKGAIEVTNCFAVPHNESDDEVAIDIEYARNMYELYRKVNAAEVIVGWYSTSGDVSSHSVLIHEYYSREAKNPVHLTVDTTVKTGKLGMKAYVSTPMGVPGRTVGTMFTPVTIDIVRYEPEQIGVNVLQQGKTVNKRSVSMSSDLALVESSTKKLKEIIVLVLSYVDDVLSGKLPADSKTGRMLMNIVTSIPHTDTEDFESMLNSNMKDLLMVVYLTNLTRTQLALNEKLSQLSS
ncbi:eukaryotic translation initiation factor 3 subunit F-like [Haliotis cracherodii]|uniref:eukaryotic translation initiation factor 3 subunit F-like n=1 Tax=Haliotis rufescens TaxID=6454 RepID=UPI001EB004B0|nr:eukaryotic translation initiation factor 3 subunit F-like [Haliotis rufescens]